MRPRRWLLAIVLFAGLPACAADLTQIVLVVESDLAVPAELDGVRVAVRGPSGRTVVEDHPLGPEGISLPLTMGLRPAGALGPVQVRVTGLLAGSVEVVQVREATAIAGETRMLRVVLSRECRFVSCEEEQTCIEGVCSNPLVPVLPPWDGLRDAGLDAGGDGGPGLDAGPDAAVGDGGADGGPLPECEAPDECDDGVACTTDDCVEGRCVTVMDDSQCSTDVACQRAICTATGCATTAAEDGSECSDGVFCNGVDSCEAGACTQHAGDPCPGASRCEEASGLCAGCVNDGDCPSDRVGSWSQCSYGDPCDEAAARQRTVTTYQCLAGSCRASDRSDTEPCARDTDGSSCGSDSYGGWSGCAYDGICDQDGSESRTVTQLVCRGGSCRSEVAPDETRACNRATDGTSCDPTQTGPFGACQDFVSRCDETGRQYATQTTYACAESNCVGTGMQVSRTCTRPTDGASCTGCASGACQCAGGLCADASSAIVTAMGPDYGGHSFHLSCPATGQSCVSTSGAGCSIACTGTLDLCCSISGSCPHAGGGGSEWVEEIEVTGAPSDCPGVGRSSDVQCTASVGSSDVVVRCWSDQD